MEEIKLNKPFNDIKIGVYILKKLIVRIQRNNNENMLTVINTIFRQFQEQLGFNNFFKVLGIVFMNSIHDVCYEIGKRNRMCEEITVEREETIEIYNLI